MKTYEQYYAEYMNAIIPGIMEGRTRIIKDYVYISCKWQVENDCNPWDKDCKERLEELKESDEKLYEAVMEGFIALDQEVKRLNDQDSD